MAASAEKEFAVPLQLVTPHMTGQKVKDAQWLLAGHSRFDGLNVYAGDVDGEYGPATALGTKRAKYWLGYPSSACDRVFGQTLYEYLRPNDWRPLPAAYRDRRQARLDAAVERPGQKALDVAITQIGTHEDPWGSNRQKYGVWYGMNGVPWCAIFDSWCFDQSGYKKFRYSYVPAIAQDAINGVNGLRIVYSPLPGDLCCHTTAAGPNEHVSFFEKWIDEAAGSFYDVGGNTGPTSISNGGAVMRQERQRQNITHFVRVG